MSKDKPPRLLKAHVEQNDVGDDASFDNNSVTLPVNWTFISHSLPLPYVVKISENTPRLLLLFVTNYWHQNWNGGKNSVNFFNAPTRAFFKTCWRKRSQSPKVSQNHYQLKNAQILREITFKESRRSKTTFFAILGGGALFNFC